MLQKTVPSNPCKKECPSRPRFYLVGFDMGAMTPCFISTRGLVLAWNVSLVIHSGPTGSLRDLSYCSRDSNGCGSCEAMYMLFCIDKD